MVLLRARPEQQHGAQSKQKQTISLRKWHNYILPLLKYEFGTPDRQLSSLGATHGG